MLLFFSLFHWSAASKNMMTGDAIPLLQWNYTKTWKYNWLTYFFEFIGHTTKFRFLTKNRCMRNFHLQFSPPLPSPSGSTIFWCTSKHFFLYHFGVHSLRPSLDNISFNWTHRTINRHTTPLERAINHVTWTHRGRSHVDVELVSPQASGEKEWRVEVEGAEVIALAASEHVMFI